MSYGAVPPKPTLLTDTFEQAGTSLETETWAERRPLLPVVQDSVRTRRRTSSNTEHSVYESLDFEEPENTVYRADHASLSTIDNITYSSLKWFVCFVIGVLTALAAFFVNLSVENISGFKFWATLIMLDRGWYFVSFIVYTFVNTLLVLSSVLATVYFAPAAAGSGIAEVKAYLNGIDVPGIFFINTLLAKVFGAIGSVAGGLAIGKEGPFVHAGAAIAAITSQGGVPGCVLPCMQRFWNDRDRSDMVSCGAAAGVAAAFRSPVGGVLFALEEMTSWWHGTMLWQAFFTTAVVSVALRVLMKVCSGSGCGFFGSGGFIIFEISEGQDNYEVYELLPVLLLGVIGGLLGSAFIVLNTRLARWRSNLTSRFGAQGKVVEALIISLVTSAVSFLLPLMNRCRACPPDAGTSCPRMDNSHSGNFVSFGCVAHNEYNDLATLFFNTQDDAIRNLFSSKTKREYTVGSLTTFTSAYYLLAVITYGISCPTGFFVPAILCGAAYGRLVGIFVADMNPHHYIDEGTYALLGAASFLGGSMRLTVCTCVMLLELTNNLALLPLVMLVLLVAKAVGDGTGVKPLYEVQMRRKGLPYLSPSPKGFMRHVTVGEACGRPAITLSRVERVSDLLGILASNCHNGFPVIQRGLEGDGHILGVITRQQLLVLLRSRRCLQTSPHVSEVSGRLAFAYSMHEFAKPISGDGLSLEDLDMPRESLDMYLDVGPYVDPSCHVVQEDTSLSKSFTLFRTLGLRHLCVIPRAREVVGVVTRHDLLPEVLEDRFDGTGGTFTLPRSAVSSHMSTPHNTSPSPPPQAAPAAALGGIRPLNGNAYLNRRTGPYGL